MPSANRPSKRAKRVYMHREARRQQIIDAARTLFGAKPFTQVSVADIADAAGVSRALVQNYFGSTVDVFMAMIVQSAGLQIDARSERAPTPVKRRLDINVPASLSAVAANRDIWYAVMGHRHTTGNEQVDAVRRTMFEANATRTLDVFDDILTDTPKTRVALRALQALWVETARAYLDDELTFDEAAEYIKTVNYAVYKTAIPAMLRVSDE